MLGLEQPHLTDIVVDLVVDPLSQQSVSEKYAFTPVSNTERPQRERRDDPLAAQTIGERESKAPCVVALDRILLVVDPLVRVLSENPAGFDVG